MIFTLSYSNGALKKPSFADLPALLKDSSHTLWIDLNRTESDARSLLTDIFHFHPMAVEDCLGELHHPKVEAYPDFIFLLLQLVTEGRHGDCFEVVTLSFFWGKNYIVTIHEGESGAFDSFREEMEKDPSLMSHGPDFIMERMLHRLFEPTRHCVQKMAQRIEKLGEAIFRQEEKVNLSALFQIRKDIVDLRHILESEEDIFLQLSRRDFPQVCNECLPYLRDVYDYIYRLSLQADRFREIVIGLLSAHQSQQAERANEVMKLLTLFAAVTLPMGIVTGFFGMNFTALPGLAHPWGWAFVLLGMGLIATGMFLFFRKKKWF